MCDIITLANNTNSTEVLNYYNNGNVIGGILILSCITCTFTFVCMGTKKNRRYGYSIE